MTSVTEELSSLRTELKRVDQRTLRSEKLLGEIQIDQHATRRSVEAIVSHFHIDVPKPTPHPADPGEAPPPDAEDPDEPARQG